MRICYLGEAASVHVRRWTQWFARRGHEVVLLSLRPAEIPGVRVVVLPFQRTGPAAFLSKVAAVRKLVRDLHPDLLHAHFAVGYGLWGAVAGWHPFVVSAWGSDVLVRPRESRVQGWVLRFVVRRADFCIPVAKHLEERMRAFGLRPEKSEAIPMGVDLGAFPPARDRPVVRSATFISTRSLEPIYDVAVLVRAAALLFRGHPSAQGTIVGGGSLRADLDALAAREGVSGKLQFEGPQPPERVMALLAQSRVYVSTSRSDGASVSLLEGMSQGCFPVVTDIPANREWIRDGENGYLVRVGDVEGLADRIGRAMTEDAILDRARAMNLALVGARGDLNRNLERVERIYERLTAGRRPGASSV